jgi:hypothetical protein
MKGAHVASRGSGLGCAAVIRRKLLICRYRGLCDFSGKLPAETGDALAERIWWKDDMAAIWCGTKRPVEQGERWRHFDVEPCNRTEAPVAVMVGGRNGSDSQLRDPFGLEVDFEKSEKPPCRISKLTQSQDFSIFRL